MNRSLSFFHPPRFSEVASAAQLLNFDMEAQQWGTWIRGYKWLIYGTATYRTRVSLRFTETSFNTYLDKLTRSIGGCPIAAVAVRERRTSGCGMPPIAAHWHFLLATAPQHRLSLFTKSKSLWELKNGKADIRAYDASGDAAHYISKLASGSDFEPIITNLERLDYGGPMDIYEHFQSNPYIPEHVRHMTYGNTLVLRCRWHALLGVACCFGFCF